MESCSVFCDAGHSLVGKQKVTCKADGTYDGDLSQSKCIASK